MGEMMRGATRVLIATAGFVTIALVVSACSQGRVDPQAYDPYTVAQRADAAAAAEAALSRAAGGVVLATETTETTDVCSPGQRNWWVQDLSAWTCSRSSRRAVAATSGDPGDAGAPLVVVLGTSRSYQSVSWAHEISGKDEDDTEPDLPPGWCACHSEGDYDCPGG